MSSRHLLLATADSPASVAIARAATGLDRTLARLARVAELYRDTALGFACEESIVYSGTDNGHIRLRLRKAVGTDHHVVPAWK